MFARLGAKEIMDRACVRALIDIGRFTVGSGQVGLSVYVYVHGEWVLGLLCRC